MADRIHATVVYCLPDRQHILPVDLPPGATLRDAVVASGLLSLEPGVSVAALDVGVFNKPRPADTRVRQGDRIEVYRPLSVDPKAARRMRAQVRRRRTAA
jgi:hypothetical protein